MKKYFFALVLVLSILLVSSASALSLDAPESIPANVNWYVSIDLDDSDFDTVLFSIDGRKILEQPMTVGRDPVVDGLYIIHLEVRDDRLFVVLRGLEEGAHTLEVETRDDGSYVDSIDWEFTAFEPMSAESGQETFHEIDELRGDILSIENAQKSFNASVNEKLDSINSALESLHGSVSSLEGSAAEIESVKSQFSSVSSDVSTLGSRLSDFSSTAGETSTELAGLSLKVDALDLQLNPPEDETEEPIDLTGLFSAAFTEGNLPVVGLLAIVALAIVAVFLWKRNSGGPLFEGASESFEGLEGGDSFDSGEGPTEPVEESAESDEKKFSGKWAFGSSEGSAGESGEKKGPGISFGQLLWKKR